MEISTLYNGRTAAVVNSSDEREGFGVMNILDLKGLRLLSEFPVIYEAGGRRISLGQDENICFSGSYNGSGLAAYSTLDGTEIWRRNNVKKIQRVSSFSWCSLGFCGGDSYGFIFDAQTGGTVEKLTRARTFYSNPFGEDFLIGGSSFELYSTVGVRRGAIPRKSFAELDCCFSDSCFLISESTGPVRCFDLKSLELLWEHKPERGYHYLRFSFCARKSAFVGIRWRYQDAKDKIKCAVSFESRSGSVIGSVPIGSPECHEFFSEGGSIITSEAGVIDIKGDF